MTYFSTVDRQRWMGLLARADARHCIELISKIDGLPPFEELRKPETGMVMLRGRIAGSGSPFNLGELTVTRCSVIALGHTGHCMVMGRSLGHAKLAALADALMQDVHWFATINASVLHPLATLEAQRLSEKQQASDSTTVNFFTLVRGEDEAG